jgi:ferritin
MYKIPVKSQNNLTDRINDEWQAVQFYQAGAIWATANNFDLMHKFAYAESADEVEHATGIQDFLADLGMIAERKSQEMNFTFADYIDFVNQALDMEVKLTEAYEADYIAASDCPVVQEFLLKYLKIQRKAVIEYMDKQRKLKDILGEFELRMMESQIFS